MMLRKSTLALGILAASLSLSLSSMAFAAVKNPDTFVLAVTGQPDTLDPAFAYDSASGEIIFQIYDGLIQYDGASVSDFKPMLATKVPDEDNGLISKDGLTYRFPIRKGVKFQNGDTLTPDDVEYTFERALLADPAGGPNWMLAEPLLGVQTIRDLFGFKLKDDQKLADAISPEKTKAIFDKVDKAITVDGEDVVFHLAQPYPQFINIISHGGSWASIISKKYTVKQGAWDGKATTWPKWFDLPKEKFALFDNAMGTGPFKLRKWDRSGEQILLDRHDDYFRGAAKFKTAVVKYIKDINTRKLMLQNGDADAINVPQVNISQVTGLDGVVVKRKLPAGTNIFMMFNQDVLTNGNEYAGSGKLDGKGIPDNFFADINVRKGFSCIFDHKVFVDQVLDGDGDVPVGPIPVNIKYANKENRMYKFDLKEAEKYFKKAFDGKLWDKGFKFILVYNAGNTTRQRACEMIRDYARRVNPKFEIEVRGVEWSTTLSARKEGRFPAYIMGWHNDYPDPHNFAFPLLHSQGDYVQFNGNTAVTLAKKDFDPVIEKAAKETNSSKRKALYYDIQEKFYDDAPLLMLYDATNTRAYRSWLKNVGFNQMWPGEGYYFWNLDK